MFYLSCPFSPEFLSLSHNFSVTAPLTFGIDNSVQCGVVMCADVCFEASLFLLLDANNYPLHLSQPPELQAVPNVTWCHW